VPRQTIPAMQLVITLVKGHARTITGLVLIAVLAAILSFARVWLSDPYRFPLEVVEVKGEFRFLSKQRLQLAVAPQVEGGFFTVDVSAIRTAAEQLPWVYKAAVKRIWPATLRIDIEEQQAAARWGERGYLNKDGEPFFPQQLTRSLALPALSGPEGHERNVLENYRRVARTLAPLNLQVTGMELDERRAWHLIIGDGVLLELGRADTRERLQRFIRAYAMVFADRIDDLRRVDLRYSNGFSVYWHQLASQAATDTQG
jgi:cell division protein FtsQ